MSLPMQDARYLARACGAAQFEESGNGNMQIAVPFEVVSDDELNGETITWFATMHDTPDKKGKTGRERVIESLVYMGFQGDDLTSLMEISDDDARALMPETVEIVCVAEPPNEYHENDRLKVLWVNRPGGGRAGFKKPLSKDEMRSFAAQMRNNLRNARGPQRQANGSSRPNGGGQSQHPNAPGNGYGGGGQTRMNQSPGYNKVDDDIPFVSCSMGDEPSPIARVLRIKEAG